MGTWLLVAYLTLCGLAILKAVLIVVQTWEHHRFVSTRLSQIHHHREGGWVALIVPCKGAGRREEVLAIDRPACFLTI